MLDRIVITNESWFHDYDRETKQKSNQWGKNPPPPKKARVTKYLGKDRYIVLMDCKGVILSQAIPNCRQ